MNNPRTAEVVTMPVAKGWRRLGGAVVLGLAVGPGLGACGDRAPGWELSADGAQAFALTDAVALADPHANRVLLLTTDQARHLHTRSVGTRRGVRTVMASPDRSKLFVLSDGDGDRRPPAGEQPQGAALEIISRASTTSSVYPLGESLAGLALDPHGDWAVVHADASSGALVRNPNELLLVNLRDPTSAGNPHPHTLRSFGGQPQRFTFTDMLNLPGGARRLLIVETEQDVAVLDLLHPDAPEITIQLTAGLDSRQLRPAGVVVTDGDPAATDDARIAIRLANDPTVILAQLVPDSGRDFRPELNLTDVGGVPGDVAFVRTDGGALKLAVLVPTRSKAVLIDPTTSVTVDVPLPAPYTRLSLVTEHAAPVPAGTGTNAGSVDVALLWNAAGNVTTGGGVAFWELGRTAGQPYRSVESVGVTAGVTSVLDVAGNHPQLKLLGTSASTFFLLDLKTRTSSPFLTSGAGVNLVPSVVGDRAWAFLPNTTQLSMIDLDSLHSEKMHIDRPVSQLFEIAAVADNPDNPDNPLSGSRSLVVWHQTGTLGVTVYDARATAGDPEVLFDEHRNYSSILTEDLDVQLP
ncbi:MAG: hypothetical protein ABJA82_02710 [Myxococcales bacterium]